MWNLAFRHFRSASFATDLRDQWAGKTRPVVSRAARGIWRAKCRCGRLARRHKEQHGNHPHLPRGDRIRLDANTRNDAPSPDRSVYFESQTYATVRRPWSATAWLFIPSPPRGGLRNLPHLCGECLSNPLLLNGFEVAAERPRPEMKELIRTDVLSKTARRLLVFQ